MSFSNKSNHSASSRNFHKEDKGEDTPVPTVPVPTASTSTTTEGQKLMDNWTEQLVQLPNVITSIRILSTPYLCYLITVSNDYTSCLIGCLLAGASDVLDGWLARNYNMKTVLGSYLDPMADKILINTLALSLFYMGDLPSPLVALWLFRDVSLILGTYLFIKSNTPQGKWVVDPGTTPLKVEPTFLGKVNTGIQFLTLFIALVQPPDTWMFESCCWLAGISTVGSTLGYIGPHAFRSSGNLTKNG